MPVRLVISLGDSPNFNKTIFNGENNAIITDSNAKPIFFPAQTFYIMISKIASCSFLRVCGEVFQFYPQGCFTEIKQYLLASSAELAWSNLFKKLDHCIRRHTLALVIAIRIKHNFFVRL